MDQLFSPENFFYISLIWSIPWKGVALWKAARLNQKVWFVILMLVNTFGLLEIVYIFFLSKLNLDLNFLQKYNPFRKTSKSK